MFKVYSAEMLASRPVLKSQMYHDRATQFIKRHCWNLTPTGNGWEVDEYDGNGTLYAIVENRGRHLASLRIRDSRETTMTKRYFSDALEGSKEPIFRGFEITRFCQKPGLSQVDCKCIISELLLGLCEYSYHQEVQTVHGIVYPGVEKLIARTGWTGRCFASSGEGLRKLMLVEWEANKHELGSLRSKYEERLVRLKSRAKEGRMIRAA